MILTVMLTSRQGSGLDAGTVVLDIEEDKQELVVHRASLLREFLKPLPKTALHGNKKLTSITPADFGIEFTFQDGTVKKFDGVVGADGVFSSVRKYVLEDAAEWVASPSGFWDSRNLVPFEKAQACLGREYFEVDRQYGWIGDGADFLHDVRKYQQCIFSLAEAIIFGLSGQLCRDENRTNFERHSEE